MKIAEHQLLASLKLWHDGDYLSSLTLAGAAEEILGKRLRILGIESSFEQIQREVVDMAQQHWSADPSMSKEIGILLNQTRNELKHYAGEASLSFDLRADAEEMLERAISNYQRLTGLVLEEAVQFWGANAI
ncbi:hypothetical protein SDC9_134655 [bioreactor metagenome]|uniref:Uncharacterized protein n=1 Tax=bioreactor metagenome TaxID=1076179 RepID=A0A645DEB3_9ZZZZ